MEEARDDSKLENDPLPFPPSHPDVAPTGYIVQSARGTLHALDQGALGMSSGVFYAPAQAADIHELSVLAYTVGNAGGVCTAHIRDERDGIVAAMRSVVENGDYIPAAMQGQRTAWHVLSVVEGFPVHDTFSRPDSDDIGTPEQGTRYPWRSWSGMAWGIENGRAFFPGGDFGLTAIDATTATQASLQSAADDEAATLEPEVRDYEPHRALFAGPDP